MNLCNFFSVYVRLPIVCALLCFLTHCYIRHIFESFIELLRYRYSKHSDFAKFYSSVICRGSNHSDRICHFKNLCYDSNTSLYLFFHNSKSIKSGLPPDRFSPTLVDFSSVLDHNTQYFNFVDLPDTALSNFNISVLNGNFLMFKRFNPENLMHVFHDDLLPSFSTLIEIYSVQEIKDGIVSFIFADDRAPGPYKDVYENILPEKPLYISSLSKQYVHCFQNIHVGLNKYSTWYQYGFKEPQGPLKKALSETSPIILSFRDYFFQRFLIQRENEKCAVLLTRKHNRKIVNENEVMKAVTDVTGVSTIALSLEEYNVFEIISKIVSCQIVIGMHGSLLILSLFLKPFSTVFEIFPYGIHPSISTPYKTLAAIPGLKLIYREWENKIEQNSFPHPEYAPELGGILHLSEKEQNEIKKSFVSPFLCCDNVFWLYRIYQDTVIDVESFKTALTETQKEKLNSQLENEAEKYELYPSEIQDCSCNITSKVNQTLTIQWKQPWNIVFMNKSSVEYEIWIQDVDTNDVRAFLTRKSVFHINIDVYEKLYYVWIRCYLDGRIGPFNSAPFVCPSNF